MLNASLFQIGQFYWNAMKENRTNCNYKIVNGNDLPYLHPKDYHIEQSQHRDDYFEHYYCDES